jgi:predicted ArsR family transcriptional regulator
VKNHQRVTSGAAGVSQSVETDASTRQRVASSILEHGPSTAAELAERLGLTPAAIRRHLDVLLASGHLEARERRVYGSRGRGRPAKVFVLTDAGRAVFYTAYDSLAIDALEFLAASAGPEAVTLFAESRMAKGRAALSGADGARRTGGHTGSGPRRRVDRGRLRGVNAAFGDR